MLELPQFAKIPGEALKEIVAWFQPWLSSSPAPAIHARRREDGIAVLADDDYLERAVRFGPGDRLFGILTTPRGVFTNAPSIILLNTGVEYHIGPHRLYVPLARYWAARGHHVLRFDLGGIGDSAPPPGAAENVAYPGHMMDDAREAIAFVRQAARRQVILAGLCSGGWLAFQAARDDLAVDAVVSINPPMYLRDRDAGAQWLAEEDELERYQHSMRDPSKWLKALSGGAAYANFVRLSASALRRSVAARVSGVLGEALPDGLASDLEKIATRGIASLFVFSSGDDGLQYFQLHAPPALRRACVRNYVQQLVVEGAGHTFRTRIAQQRLRQILIDFVESRTSDIN
jgi:pimeloyl-ACP methyl ester carboxylesterase